MESSDRGLQKKINTCDQTLKGVIFDSSFLTIVGTMNKVKYAL